jgi:type IV pilus assembly protein PilW
MSTEARTVHRGGQRGLSLIELLVGVAVGMIGILIIFQTMSVWNKHARTTSSGSDARSAGTLAIYNIERDLKLAGMGFATAASGVMGCNVVVRGGMFTMPMAPVVITASASGPDTIDILHGNSAFFVTEEKFTLSTAFSKKMKRRGGFKAGDLAVVAGEPSSSAPTPCHLIQVTDVSNADGVTLAHNPGDYTSHYTNASASGIFNPAAGTGTTFTTGTMYNLGPLPQRNRWEVVDGSLINTDAIHSAAAFQTAEGVVDLKAQYGVDSNGDMRITDAAPNEWSASAPASWTQVLAVRVAILVRSRQYEKDNDTSAAATPPTWFGTPFTMRNVDGTTDTNPANSPNNWRNYRYRVYERVVPLRNMIWGTS